MERKQAIRYFAVLQALYFAATGLWSYINIYLRELGFSGQQVGTVTAVGTFAAMLLLLDSFLVPLVFMASIGMAILYNMGTNILLGEISFITMAIPHAICARFKVEQVFKFYWTVVAGLAAISAILVWIGL